MDARLREAGNNIQKAWDRLTDDEVAALDHEKVLATGASAACARYYLENYFVINTKGEDWQAQRLQTVYPFTETQEILWAEIKMLMDLGLPVWLLLLKARQIRWSTLVQGLIFQRTTCNKLTNTLVIADELKRSNKIFEMSLLAYNKLPWWMRPEKATDNRGAGVVQFDRKDAALRISEPGLQSWFYVDAANKPAGSSRGFTLHNMHATEFGLWERPRILTSDLIPAIPKKNPMVVSVVEGTAQGSGENYSFLRMWNMAMNGKGLFKPVFAAWWKEKTYCKPFPSTMDEDAFIYSPEETELLSKVKDEFGYEITKPQMNWRREQAEQFEATEGDPEKVEQEYPSYPKSAFRSGGICAFSVKKLATIEVRDVRIPIWAGELVHRKIAGQDKEQPILVKYFSRKPDSDQPLTPHEQVLIRQAPLWVWEWPNSKDLYYEASDPSKGIPGLDFGGIQVFRVPRKNGERVRQCLEYRGYADPRELSKMAVAIGHMYNTCEMAPECNNMTEHIGNILHVHGYPKVYRWHRQDKILGRWSWFFGWDTGTHKHREDLITRFSTGLSDDSLEIKSSRLLSECLAFIKGQDTDRFEAAAGEHDDILFAAMICFYCLMELDPRLFTMADQVAPPDPKIQAHNTDVSLFDEVTEKTPEYNSL